MDFSRRNGDLAESLDSPEALPRDELEANLRDIDNVNRWLGGSRACLKALAECLDKLPSKPTGKQLWILDVGCGGGGIVAAVAEWACRRRESVKLIALDHNPSVCRLAQRWQGRYPEITVVQADVFQLPFKADSLAASCCSAFLHHFDDDQIVAILRGLGRVGVWTIVNDLHRHRLAYWGIRVLSRLLTRSEATRWDGPVSVLRAFRRAEIASVIERSGAVEVALKWRWAFRWSARFKGRMDPRRFGQSSD